jgi:type II secretory pathway pseudopilin PulG
MRVFRRILISGSGMTLVEVAFVMAISAIVFTGVLIAYTEGVGHWQDTSEEFTLYNEGTAALSLMGRFIRQASFISIKSYSGVASARLELDYPEDIGSATFYFVREDGSLRWNDQTEGRNRFNQKLLPAVRYRQGLNETPYLIVRDASFTPLDDIGFQSPTLLGYSLVRIELILEDSRGDTLYLSSVVSKRNR